MKERARLPAVAERNRENIVREKREREEAAQAAVVAKAARKGAKTPDSSATAQGNTQGTVVLFSGDCSSSARSHCDSTEEVDC